MKIPYQATRQTENRLYTQGKRKTRNNKITEMCTTRHAFRGTAGTE